LRPWTAPQGQAPTAIVVPPLPLPEPPPAPEPSAGSEPSSNPLASDVFDFTVDLPGMVDAGSQISQGTQPAPIALSDTIADGEWSVADPQTSPVSTDHEAANGADSAAAPQRLRWLVRWVSATWCGVQSVSTASWNGLSRGIAALATVARAVWRRLVAAATMAWRAWLDVPTPLKVTLIVCVTLGAAVIALMAYSLM
jgi:hypothetical protein